MLNPSAISSFFASLTVSTVIPAILILIVGLIAVKLLLKLFRKALERSKLERSLHTFLLSTMRILLYAILAIIVVGTLGINVTSLVAVLSVASLALSLAVQGVLSNLAGGLQILTTHPFRVGDYVEFGGISGTIAEIGLVYTQITTVDNKEIFVPNSEVSTSKIINYTTENTRRVDLTFTASYDSPVEDVKTALFDAAARVPTILNDPPIFVRVLKYNDSNIEYVVRAWTSTADYWDSYFDLTENVKKVFDEKHIIMTYPHLNVHMDQ